MGNLRTIAKHPYPLKDIPDYPRFDLMVANGGEITYDIDDGLEFGTSKQVIPFERPAQPGELLRDESLRYIADITDNLNFRGEVLATARDNPRMQELQIKYCESDILYFVNVFCWTFVPGEQPVPFILYDFQQDILTWMLWMVKRRLKGAVEKSRDMGLSWLTIALIAYLILFNDSNITYLLSMTKDEVDDKSEDSLMGKLRILLNNLPEWMKGGWDRGGYVELPGGKKESIDKEGQLIIPLTKSRVSGKLTGGQAGRSGRAVLCIYDEFAFVEDDTKVLNASAGLSKCSLFVSTVCGKGNEFARITHAPGVLKKSPHWTSHPLKNKKWAILERSNPIYTEEYWNQEHEIDYTGSTSGRVFPKFISRINEEDRKGRWYHVQEDWYFGYDEMYDVLVGMDFGLADPNFVIYAQLKPTPPAFAHQNPYKTTLVIFDEDRNVNQIDNELAIMLKRREEEYGYRYSSIVGDLRSGHRRDGGGITMKMRLQKHGFNLLGKFNTEEAPIKHVRNRMAYPGAIAFYRFGCPQLIESVENWSFPVDKFTKLPKPGSKPLHNQYSHGCKALCYMVDHLDAGMKTEKRKKGKVVNWDYDPIPSFSI